MNNNQFFQYRALTPNGEEISGTFEGSSEAFEEMIVQKKIAVFELKKIEKKLDKSPFKNSDFLSLIEELYHLVNAGISIDQAIKMLIGTATKQSTLSILKSVLQKLKEGKPLSNALAESFNKENFKVDALSISFISTAEEVGDIAKGLQQLFEYLSFQKKIRNDVRQALSYPLFLLIMSLLVSLLIFFVIVPKFATIFSPEEFEQLPSLSYTILSFGKYLNEHMTEFFTLIAAFFITSIILLKKFSIPWLTLFYYTPKLSNIIVSLQLSIIYGALSNMLSGGLELDRALRQVQNIKLLPQLHDLLKNSLFELKKGEKLSTLFAMSNIIPQTDIALLYVGENSANLSTIFKSLATRHEEIFQQDVKKILAILEPAIIVLLGIFIATIVVSIMMAVMSMTDIAG